MFKRLMLTILFPCLLLFVGTVSSSKPLKAAETRALFSVTLQGKTKSNGTDITLRFFAPESSTELSSFTAKPDAPMQTITLPENIALDPKPYDIVISAPGYLRKKANITPARNATIMLPQLSAGDLNGDNAINSLDWSRMNVVWYQSDALADFNDDGIVNSIDFSYLNRNWGKQGDQTGLTAGISISQTADAFVVSAGPYAWTVSKKQFDVVSSLKKGDSPLLKAGQASVDFMGKTIVFGAPSEFSSGADWVEMRGWASQADNLWYVARYRFWEGKPYTHLALTLTDRHETAVTYGPWDTDTFKWGSRLISNLTVNVSTATPLPDQRYIQYNSHFGGKASEPWVELVAAEGAPYQWFRQTYPPGVDSVYQIYHGSMGNGRNQVIWHPQFSGSADLEIQYIPYTGYPVAQGATYEVHHAGGAANIVVDSSQIKNSSIALGRFTLDENSTVILKDTASGGGRIVANTLVVKPSDGRASFEVKLGNKLADNVLTSGSYAFIVQDLWQHHPLEVFSAGNAATQSGAMGAKAILKPTILMGGMGLTLDFAIVADGSSTEALALLQAPPATRLLPPWWDAIEPNQTYFYSIFAYDKSSNYSSPAFQSAMISFSVSAPPKEAQNIGMDSDNDGLADDQEDYYGTDKNNPDTDNDGYSDKIEIESGNDPLNPTGKINLSLTNKLKGKILIQVQSKGYAWYVNPADGKRYYLKDGEAAYEIMRKLGLGTTTQNLIKIPYGRVREK